MEPLDVTVCIPSIPERAHLLTRCLESIHAQTVTVAGVRVVIERPDPEVHPLVRLCRMRTNSTLAVPTKWVAIIDDDDYYLPEHFGVLFAEMTQSTTGPEPDVIATRPTLDDPRLPYLPADVWPIQHANALVRVDALKNVGYWRSWAFDGQRFTDTGAGDGDWDLWRRLQRAGSWFHRINDRTWVRGEEGRHIQEDYPQ